MLCLIVSILMTIFFGIFIYYKIENDSVIAFLGSLAAGSLLFVLLELAFVVLFSAGFKTTMISETYELEQSENNYTEYPNGRINLSVLTKNGETIDIDCYKDRDNVKFKEDDRGIVHVNYKKNELGYKFSFISPQKEYEKVIIHIPEKEK